MSAHMKEHHTKKTPYIQVTIGLPGNKTLNYKIPNTDLIKDELTSLLETWTQSKEELITPWEESTPWETIAADRIKKYKKQGLFYAVRAIEKGFLKKN